MRKSIVVVAIALAAALCVPCGAQENGGQPHRNGGHGGKRADKAWKAGGEAGLTQAVWLVSAVQASTNANATSTITLQTSDSKQSKTCKLDRITMITVNGKDGKVDDLKPGMKVTFITGGDPSTLASITASDYAAPPAPKKAKHAKRQP